MTIHLGWSTLLWIFALIGAGVLVRMVVMTVMFMFMDWVPPWERRRNR